MGMKTIDLHITLPEYDETQAFVEHCLQTGDRPDIILNPDLLAYYLRQDGIKDGAKYVIKAAKHFVCNKCTGRKMFVVLVDNRARIGCIDCSGEDARKHWHLEASLYKALRKREMTFDELMELKREVGKIMSDAFARDDIELFRRMAKLCEHINGLSMAIHMQHIDEAIQEEFERRRPVL